MSTIRERYIKLIAEEMLFRHRARIDRARDLAERAGAELVAPNPEPTFLLQAEAMLNDEIAKMAGEACLAKFRTVTWGEEVP